MPIRSLYVLKAILRGEARGTTAVHDRPARVVLGVREGCTPSDKPPVRIFIGTEARQFRAERVMLWSIERHRDPSRVYEIYLMKDLRGFRRHGWLTGFTNYRFAIPHFAGNRGRAIYNDVDQIYLEDPAHLFDTDMDGHGYLSIHDCDTSVMLIDCERMAGVWPLDAARNEKRRTLDDYGRLTPGLWGPLDPGWNARDTEYHPDTSRLVHFTTIHTQPWRPFPREYVYGDNPVGELWHGYEREADAAGFLGFTAGQPGPDYADHLACWRLDGDGRPVDLAPAADLLRAARAESVLYCGLRTDASAGLQPAPAPLDPAALADLAAEPAPRDAVVCAGFLEYMPDQDIPWLLEALFARARRVLSLAVAPREAGVPGGHRTDPLWWREQVAGAASRHPHVHWQLAVRTSRRGTQRWEGGAPLHWLPRVWVLAHHKPGHSHQAQDIAETLGWPYERMELPPGPVRPLLGLMLDRLTAGRRPGTDALHETAGTSPRADQCTDPPGGRASSRADRRPGTDGVRERTPSREISQLAPPWPDLVIASGWLPVRIARRIGRRSGGRTRLVLMGRKAGPAEESDDILVSCAHFRLAPHPRRIQPLLPVHGPAAANPGGDDQAGMKDTAGVVLLVGGTSRGYRLDPGTARDMVRAAREFARERGAALTVITSRRTGAAVEAALAAEIGNGNAQLLSWQQGARREDYNRALAGASAIVVSGDSESMLAEAIMTGKPVYIHPLPRRRPNPWQRFSGWVERQAYRPRYNRRGTIRPQEGLRYLCARLIERGLVLPPRKVEPLHEELFRRGLAYDFTQSPAEAADTRTGEIPEPATQVAARIIELLQWEPYGNLTGTVYVTYGDSILKDLPRPGNDSGTLHGLSILSP